MDPPTEFARRVSGNRPYFGNLHYDWSYVQELQQMIAYNDDPSTNLRSTVSSLRSMIR